MDSWTTEHRAIEAIEVMTEEAKQMYTQTISPQHLKKYEDFKNNKAKWVRQMKAEWSTKTEKYWTLRKILLEAVKTGNLKAVSCAISHRADAILYLEQPAEYGFRGTFLHVAARHGHHNIIDCLLKAGVDVDDPGFFGEPPIHVALEYNHVEFVRKLINSGAELESALVESLAHTPLHTAVVFGSLECIKLLLQANVNIEAIANFNYTPLHKAAQHNQLSAIEMLLDAGCNRDARIHLGGSALHVAAIYNNREAVELLIENGFDLELKDNAGHTPIESAEVRGHEPLAHWLTKLKKGTSNEDTNIGPLPSSDQTAKFKYSLRNYISDNDKFVNFVGSASQGTFDWKSLKRIIPKYRSGYYQDEEGLTILHVVSKHGYFEAVTFLIEELHIFSNLITHNGDVPSDLAESAGHHRIAQYLKNAFKHNKPPSINIQNQLYDELLTVISSGDNVQEASRLLTKGAPLESYGSTSPSALAMAILWNRVMIIELLLAAGAPLTVKHHGKNLLQVAWFSPDITMRVKIIITRAFHNNLQREVMEYLADWVKEQSNLLNDYLWNDLQLVEKLDISGKMYLYAGLIEVSKVLKGETPWKAKWTIKEEIPPHQHLLELMPQYRLSNNPLSFSLMMGTAAKHNCKLAAFFLHEAGGRPNHRTALGLTPLHEALDAKFFDLATVLVKHLGGSLYVPDCNRRFPKDLMKTEMKLQLEQVQAMEEFNKLENSIYSARTQAEKDEIKEIALVLICLYAVYTRKWDHHLCKWQDLYGYLVSIILVKTTLENIKFESGTNKVNLTEDYTWLLTICQNLNQVNKRNQIPNEDAVIGFLDLLSSIEDLSNSIRTNETKLKLIQSDNYCQSANIAIGDVLLKSVKLVTETNLPTFLHLLFTVGEQSLDMQLNNMIRSLPLHHAAATGNFCAILYLTLTAEAPVNVLDRNKNTPAHLAYLNGYSYIGDYLCKHDQNIELIKNNASQTPKMIHKAFQKYEKLYDIEKDEYETDNPTNINEQIDGLSLTTKLLDQWFSKSKSMSFREIIENSIVDYSFGEAKLVQSLIVDFAESIGSKIAEYNPLLKGTLVLVGSAGDKVRLNAPDESDCTWLLDWKNVRVYLEDMSEEDQQIKHYKHVIRAESDDMKIQRLLEGTNLLEEFYNQSIKAISDLLPNLDPRISLIIPGVKRIGCGVCITLAWAGTRYPMLIVTMDLVPAFKASRPAKFIHPPLTKNIEDPRLDAIFVVQTHIKSGELRCSTTLEEQVVMQGVSIEQRLVFIIAKLLVSKLKTEKWASKLFKERFTYFSTKQFKLPAPTGFLLKSAFFQVLENTPDPDDWAENCIVDRLKDIFFSMCETDDKGRLHSGLVPSYFSSTIQPPAAGFMAPAVYKFLVDNEEELHHIKDFNFEELEQLALMWDEALNKYYYIP